MEIIFSRSFFRPTRLTARYLGRYLTECRVCILSLPIRRKGVYQSGPRVAISCPGTALHNRVVCSDEYGVWRMAYGLGSRRAMQAIGNWQFESSARIKLFCNGGSKRQAPYVVVLQAPFTGSRPVLFAVLFLAGRS